MKFVKYTLMVLFAAGLMSCGGGGSDEKPDTSDPVITLTSPTSNTTISASADLQVTANITDKELKSYKVKIDPGVAAGVALKGNPSFSFDSAADKDASGNDLPAITESNKTNFSLSFKIDLDDAAAQDYTFTIQATDMAGNTAEVLRKIKITRP